MANPNLVKIDDVFYRKSTIRSVAHVAYNKVRITFTNGDEFITDNVVSDHMFREITNQL